MTVDYARQQSLRIPKLEISVVGVGGTGSWVALFSAISGSPKIKLFDPDILEIHNLNRLPFPAKAVNKLKVIAMKELIHQLRPECTVLTFDTKIDESSISLLEGTVYDCTDNRKSQDMIQEYCEKEKLSYRRVGYDGNHITTITKGVPQNTQKEPQNGYQIIPSWVIPSVLSASLGVFSVLRTNNQSSFIGDIHKLYNLQEEPSAIKPIDRNSRLRMAEDLGD